MTRPAMSTLVLDGSEIKARLLAERTASKSVVHVDWVRFTCLLRNAPDSPNQMIPVIMVTGHSTERRVREARDAGVNEFVAKPVTARGVLERIHEVIDHPRPYVRRDDYFGPDRRRHEDAGYLGPRRRSGDNADPIGGGDAPQA